MKKNGFFAVIGLITVLAAAAAAVYYFVCKKHFCFGCCENEDLCGCEGDDDAEETCGCCCCDEPEEVCECEEPAAEEKSDEE